MVTKEECNEALEHIKTLRGSNYGWYYSGFNNSALPFDEDTNVISKLIKEHFDNPPLEWEEIQELKNGDIIFDNLNKKNLKINFIEVSRWGEKIIDGWLEGDIMSLVYLFEPNRFYRKEVRNVD